MGDLRSRAERARAHEAGKILEALDETATRAEQSGEPVRYENPAPSAPDVEDSPIAADLGVPVHVAWGRVMADVQWIGKGRQARDYMYRGVDDVMNFVAPAIRKHGVIVMPVKVEPEYTVINTTAGKSMNYCRAVVSFVVMGPTGDVLSVPNDAGVMVPLVGQAVGEGFDTGDKSSMKAQSVAQREFYIKALSIQVDRPAMDPEHGPQHEIGVKAPTAEEYAAEIVDKRTSLDRLRQIKAELFANRAMGSTEVEPFGYEKTRLVDLVQQVGRARAGGGKA